MNFFEFLSVCKKHFLMIIVLPLLSLFLTSMFICAFVPNMYTSNAQVYMLSFFDEASHGVGTPQDTNYSVNLSQSLSADFATYAVNDEIKWHLDDFIKYSSNNSVIDYSLDAKSSTKNRFVQLSVCANDPETAANICKEYANFTCDQFNALTQINVARVASFEQVSDKPTSPNLFIVLPVSFVSGLLLALILVYIIELTKKIKKR